LSKNEFVFTPSKNTVNEKYTPVTTRVFNRVQLVHSPMTENCAETISIFHANGMKSQRTWRFREFCRAFRVLPVDLRLFQDCENRAKGLPDKGFRTPSNRLFIIFGTVAWNRLCGEYRCSRQHSCGAFPRAKQEKQ